MIICGQWFEVNAAQHDTVSNACITFTDIKPKVEKHEEKKIIAGNDRKQTRQQNKQTLWAIFVAGMAGGFAALLMLYISDAALDGELFHQKWHK